MMQYVWVLIMRHLHTLVPNKVSFIPENAACKYI